MNILFDRSFIFFRRIISIFADYTVSTSHSRRNFPTLAIDIESIRTMKRGCDDKIWKVEPARWKTRGLLIGGREWSRYAEFRRVYGKRRVLSRDGRKPDGETFYVCRVTVTSGVGWPEAHRCRLNGATKTEWVIWFGNDISLMRDLRVPILRQHGTVRYCENMHMEGPWICSRAITSETEDSSLRNTRGNPGSGAFW